MGTPHYIAYISASNRYFSILIWWTVTLDISLSTHTIIFNKKLHTFSTVPNFVKEGIFHFFENCDFLQQKPRNWRASSGLKLVNGIILLCQINHSSHKHLPNFLQRNSIQYFKRYELIFLIIEISINRNNFDHCNFKWHYLITLTIFFDGSFTAS